MYQLGDRVVYGVHGVCVIVGQESRIVDRKRQEYFALEPLDQRGARFYVPLHSPAAMAKLRPVLTGAELEELLRSDHVCRDIWIPDEGKRRLQFRELINSGDRATLMAMIGSLYRHKENQAAAGRKFHLTDENFLRDAKKILSSEFSLVLGMNTAQIDTYFTDKLRDSASVANK